MTSKAPKQTASATCTAAMPLTAPDNEKKPRRAPQPHGFARSVGVPFAQHFKEGLDQDLDVQPKAPVVDIPKIKLHALGDPLNRRGCTARSIALRPPRHPRLHVMTECIITQHSFEVIVMGQ